MSLQEIKDEVETWPANARDELAAHLAVLSLREDKDLGKELSSLINDKRPERWLTLEQMDKRLASNEVIRSLPCDQRD